MSNIATTKLKSLFSELEFSWNNGQLFSKKYQIGSQIIRTGQPTFKGVYDFAVQGGAIGSINLYDPTISAKSPGDAILVPKPLVLPPNFVINNVVIDVITAVASAGAATLALTSGQTTADVLAATAKTSFVVGLLAGIPANTVSTSFKLAALSAGQYGYIPQVSIAVAALTAGKMNVHFEGFYSD